MLRPRVFCGFFALIAVLGVAVVTRGQYVPPPGQPIPPVQPGPSSAVVEILGKLDAIKAKRQAIDQEEQALLAKLREQLNMPARVMPGYPGYPGYPPPTYPVQPCIPPSSPVVPPDLPNVTPCPSPGICPYKDEYKKPQE